MPFTPSHAAAVLPLRRGRWTATALVIGSMAPDLVYFLPWPRIPRTVTHSLLGLVTIDVVIGLLVLFAVQAAVAPPAAALLRAPSAEVVRRWGTRVPRDSLAVWLAVEALVIGGLTHLVWDAFTHADSPVVTRWDLLAEKVGRFTVYQWLQYGSSFVGLAILALAAYRAGLRPAALRQVRPTGWWCFALVTAGAALVSLALASGADGARSLAFRVSAGIVIGAGLVVATWAVAWWSRAALRGADRA